jgi:hypothetical protein
MSFARVLSLNVISSPKPVKEGLSQVKGEFVLGYCFQIFINISQWIKGWN